MSPSWWKHSTAIEPLRLNTERVFSIGEHDQAGDYVELFNRAAVGDFSLTDTIYDKPKNTERAAMAFLRN